MEDVLFCRLCAHKKERFVGIFDEEGHKLNIERKINKCLHIEVYQSDSLPKSVCMDCCFKLDQFSTFMDSSVSAQTTLHRLFQNNVSDLKDDISIDDAQIQLTSLDCNTGFQVEKAFTADEHQRLQDHVQQLHHGTDRIESIQVNSCNSDDIYEDGDILEDEDSIDDEAYEEDGDTSNEEVEQPNGVLNNESELVGFVECLVNEKESDGLSKRKRSTPIKCFNGAEVSMRVRRKVTKRRTHLQPNGSNRGRHGNDTLDIGHVRLVQQQTHIVHPSVDQAHPQHLQYNSNNSNGEVVPGVEYSNDCKIEDYTEYISATGNSNCDDPNSVIGSGNNVKSESGLLVLNSDDSNCKINDNNILFKEITSWPCTDCSEELPNIQALKEHHTVVHKQAPKYMCGQCSEMYTQYHSFYVHIRRHKNSTKYSCDECGKGFSNRKVLDLHLSTHSDNRPYVCTVCGKGFRQQNALYIHGRCHLPDEVKNKFACDQCDKRFSTKPNLVTHKRIHSGVRNFTCDQCGKSFIQKGNLDAHLLTHSQDKPFNCHLCNKGFKTTMQLRKHHSVHTGAKPHACDVCGRTFRERGTLREHHRIHTGAMPFTCEFCGKAFRFKGILTTHRRQHTGERPYSCLECQHHFTNWPNYNKHMKRRHGINTSRTTRVKLTPPELQSAADNAGIAGADAQQMYDDSISGGPAEELTDRLQQTNANHFYQPAINVMTTPMAATYHVAPPPNTMLSFYNLAQVQTLDPSGNVNAVSINATPVDVIHTQQVIHRR